MVLGSNPGGDGGGRLHGSQRTIRRIGVGFTELNRTLTSAENVKRRPIIKKKQFPHFLPECFLCYSVADPDPKEKKKMEDYEENSFSLPS